MTHLSISIICRPLGEALQHRLSRLQDVVSFYDDLPAELRTIGCSYLSAGAEAEIAAYRCLYLYTEQKAKLNQESPGGLMTPEEEALPGQGTIDLSATLDRAAHFWRGLSDVRDGPRGGREEGEYVDR